jgi:putative hydroxymethylpyrimidine transport system substrate-binding protein
VQKIDVGFDLVAALVSKQADAIIGAYWVHESIVAELQGHPVNIMRVEQYGVPDFYELVLVTNEKMIEDNEESVRKFLRATVKGYEDIRKDPQAGINVLMQRAPDTDRRVEERGIVLLAPLWTDGAPKFGWQDPERWLSYGEWMVSNNLLPRPLDWNRAFTNEFLP